MTKPFKKTGFYLLSILLIVALVLAGCSSNNSGVNQSSTGSSSGGQSLGGGSQSEGGSSEEDRYGGELNLIVNRSLTTLGYPAGIRTQEDIMVSFTALEALGRHDETGNTVPHLAKGWDIDADNLKITVQLNEGIKFHDGTVFDAEAAKWNLEDFKAFGRAEAAAIESIEVTGPYEFVIHLNTWDNSIIDQLFPFATMISPTAFEQNGGRDWATSNPVGTGPFKMVRWEKDVAVEYERNENYWKPGLPYLDKVIWHQIADPSSAEAAMIAGGYQMYYNTSPRVANSLASHQFDVMVQKNGMGAPGLSLAPSSADPNSPLSKKEVRKAISYAIDRQAIVDAIFFGYHIPTDQWSVPDGWAYATDAEKHEYNPEKAKQLLAEAGYPNGFTTQIIYQTNPDNTQVFTAVQGYLADVGIKVELVPVENAKWQELSLKPGVWDGLLHSTFRMDNDIAFNFIRNLSKNGTHYGQTAFPEELEPLIVESRTVKTFEEKTRLVRQLNKEAFGEHAVNIAMYVNGTTSVKDPKVQDDGFHLYYSSVWTPEQTWIKK